LYNGDKTSVQKLTQFTVSKTWHNNIPVGATWGRCPHNLLAVGAIAPIAPMESVPMVSAKRCISYRNSVWPLLFKSYIHTVA